jgi:RNA polymerase sigma-70 factor, ECF subfamily
LEQTCHREHGLTATDDQRLDPAVVAALYQEHSAELRWFVLGVVRRRDMADEVLQNTFVKVTESGHTARKPTLKGWLFRVALHEALALRRQGVVECKAVQVLAEVAPQAVETTQQVVSRRETIAQVRLALEQLPAHQREVVRLRIYEQKKFAVIARELKVPLGTVLTRMRSALAKLRQRLDEGKK